MSVNEELIKPSDPHNRKNRFSKIVRKIGAALFVIGCGVSIHFYLEYATNKKIMTTYSYPETLTHSLLLFKINKVEILKEQFKLYLTYTREPKITPEKNTISLYDKSFNLIEENANFTIDNDLIIINTSNAPKISAITIKDDSSIIAQIRYLTSQQYSMLEYIPVFDLGITTVGDKQTFYTQEEIEKIKNEKLNSIKNTEDAFNFVKGTWQSDDGNYKVTFSPLNESQPAFLVSYTNNKNGEIFEYKMPVHSGRMTKTEDNNISDIALITGHNEHNFSYKVLDANTMECGTYNVILKRIIADK